MSIEQEEPRKAPPVDDVDRVHDRSVNDEQTLSPDMPAEMWSEPKLGAKIEGETEDLVQEAVLPSDQLEVGPARLLDLAVRLGVKLMEHGAETYRVEDSVARILHAYKAHEPSAFAVPSLIAVSFKDDGGRVYTKTIRVTVGESNLDRVYRINTLSRYLTQHTPDLDYFASALDEIGRSERYPMWQIVLASGVVASGFNMMFNNSVRDLPIAFAGGLLVRILVTMLRDLKMNTVFNNVVGGFIASFLTQALYHFGLGHDATITAIAILMNLVPGALLTNAIRDVIATDYMSGMTKLTQALMVAASLAVGAGVGYAVVDVIGGML